VADVPGSDVVAPDDKNVGFLLCRNSNYEHTQQTGKNKLSHNDDD
jgi:hypothetical protein